MRSVQDMDLDQPIEFVTEDNTDPYTFNDFYRVANHVKFNRRTFCTPSSVTLRRTTTDESDSLPQCRVYFISYPRHENAWRFQPTLFCADVCSSSPFDAELPWFQLVPDDFGSERSSVTLAESLLRERMRTSARGLADYEIDESGRIVATASGRIFCAADSMASTRIPEVLDFTEAPVLIPLQPAICPTNGDLIACVANSQLTVGHVPSNTWVPLTHVTTESGLSVGMPSYVVQEEFDRYIGYWWRPFENKKDNLGTARYHILYEVVDERPVEVVHLLAGTQIETHRYPRAGGANAISDLRLCAFDVTADGEVLNVNHLVLPRPLFSYIPGFEYLVRAGWTPDGNYVWCQLITRTQNRLELILIPVANFQSTLTSTPSDPSMQIATDVPTVSHTRSLPCIRLVVEEDVQFWVKVHDHLAFLTKPWHPVPQTHSSSQTQSGATSAEYHLTFVWASHRSGYSHLYLMQRTWLQSPDLIGDVTGGEFAGAALILDAEEVFTSQLTTGSWEVTGKRLWLDETHQLVYFEANRQHPLLQNVYAVSYACSTRGQLTLLTPTSPAVVDEVSPLGGDSQPAQPHSVGPKRGTRASCYDPYFPSDGQTADYPLSYEVNALDVDSGWAVLSSSSLSRLPGTQIVQIAFHPNTTLAPATSVTASTSSGANSDSLPLSDSPRLRPVFHHVAWLRHHVSHDGAMSPFIHPCDPPKVVRFDIEQAEFDLAVANSDSLGLTAQSTANQTELPAGTRSQTYLYGLLYLPRIPAPPDGFPVVHYVYGGPSIQLVKGTYSKSILMHAMLYCHFGYAVFLCDCRGSANRGVQFAGHIKGRMGQVELDDHVEFLKYVAKSTGLLDLSRVAITGYSYGGYMSLMAAMRYSHIYRAAVAGSPVVDWIFYDTAYTERYLGLPRENPTAYWNGNVIRYVDKMPSGTVRLMICHGGQDENVHFAHTSRLLQKLESAGKPFNLQYYPNSRHGIKEYEHLEASLLQLLESVLKPVRSTCTSVMGE